MVNRRVLRHLLIPHWHARRPFTPAVLQRIEKAIQQSERSHRGEIRFALEAALPPSLLKITTRKRAEQVFGELGVWDTEENSGVLIYVQLVERAIEIVADRGIARLVPQAEWDALCRAMEKQFRDGNHLQGSLDAIAAITAILKRHFPARAANPNELPDAPAVL